MATDHNKKTMTTSEAGKMGGDKVAKERGPEFYSEIGQQQGKDNNPGNFANRPKSDVADAGRKGGEASGQARQDDRKQSDYDQAA